MRARRQKSGRVFYYLDTGGKPRREIPLGDDYIAAVTKWAELTRDSVPLAAPAVVFFRAVAERYVREMLPLKAERTRRDNMTELGFLYRFFDDPPAPFEAIEPVHVRQYLDWRGATAKVRANREKALLSAIWNFARERGITAKENPCRGVRGFSEAGRDIYIERSVFDAVYAQAGIGLRDAMALAYLTGQRPSDVLRMTDSDIVAGVLVVVQGKTGKKLRIRLADDAGIPNSLGLLLRGIAAVKTSARGVVGALVCSRPGVAMTQSAYRGQYDAARSRAAALADAAGDTVLAEKIRAFQFRDLRAKAGTDKAGSAGMRAAQKQLGHASMKMTEHYVRDGDLVDPTE